MRRVLWCLLAVLLHAPTPAQDSLRTAPHAEVPDEALQLRPFSDDALERYRNEEGYQYDRYLQRAPTPWEQLKELLREWLDAVFGNRVGSTITEYLIYILTVALLVFAVAVLSRNGLRNAFHGAPRSLAGAAEPEEDIRALDLPLLIDAAERDGDLRLAVRLRYLLVLRQLVDSGILRWSPELTDGDYLRQITEPGLRTRFREAATIFQWVWYGGMRIDAARYQGFQPAFSGFGSASAP
jgi:hypothetical protein